jgi:hypothetical protein
MRRGRRHHAGDPHSDQDYQAWMVYFHYVPRLFAQVCPSDLHWYLPAYKRMTILANGETVITSPTTTTVGGFSSRVILRYNHLHISW